MRNIQAYALFYIGDLFSKIAYWKHAERFRLLWTWDAYQWFMNKSGEIQDKHSLDGPWKKTE